MKLGEFIEGLEGKDDLDLTFTFAGREIGGSYHITEIKHARIESVDCGGTRNQWTEVVFQLLEPGQPEPSRRMTVGRALPAFMDRIQEEERELLRAVALDAVAQRDLAAARNLPYSTLKSRVRKARASLKREIIACCEVSLDARNRVVDRSSTVPSSRADSSRFSAKDKALRRHPGHLTVHFHPSRVMVDDRFPPANRPSEGARMDLKRVKSESARLSRWAHIATVGRDGNPDVVPVHPAWEGDTIWFMTGAKSVKVRNIAHHPNIAMHWQVTEAGDGVEVWGTAKIHTDVDTKKHLWNGVFDYDLNQFAPRGPEGSPDIVFVAVRPERALYLAMYGMKGRETWSA